MRKKTKRVLLTITVLSCLYTFFLINPGIFFKHSYQYKNFNVFSDRTIPIEIEQVLDKAHERLQRSELYNDSIPLNLYFCNDNWRFYFFARNRKAGAVVNGFLSANAFFRHSDISTNRLIPENGWTTKMLDRPLSYFVAHELTHSLQSHYDRFLVIKLPTYIIEGYADYIGKGYAFSYSRYKKMLLEEDPAMKPKESGLYNLYHLAIAYWMDKKQLTFKEIVEKKPDLEITLQEILKN